MSLSLDICGKRRTDAARGRLRLPADSTTSQ
jgi:hypothetical protein